MSDHGAIIRWERKGAQFLNGKYSREHTWRFDGGATIQASAAPSNVPLPFSNPANVDPEEAFVASISSCHMLWFLYLAGRAGFEIESYEDHALGRMTKDATGRLWVSDVVLDPTIVWTGPKIPTAAEQGTLHHAAHEECFIANSVKTKITVKSVES